MPTNLILHSHQLNEHGEPGKEYQARISEGIELLSAGKVDTILFTGGVATKGIDTMHSEAAKEWALRQGVDIHTIFTERTGSLETVGELLFARIEHDNDLLLQENNVIVLSSDYHIPRLASIANFILGPRTTGMTYIGINGFHRTIEDEKRSLDAFYKTFAGIPSGNLDRITDTLWQNHGLYRNHPKNPYYKKS